MPHLVPGQQANTGADHSVFEMSNEEGNGDVKTQELERLMSLMGINPTKRELSQMAKDGEYKPAMTVKPSGKFIIL